MADFFAKGNKPINGYGGGNLASKSDLTNIFQTGSTATQAIGAGTYFYLNGVLVRAKTAIAIGATFTLNTNYEAVTAGALNEIGIGKWTAWESLTTNPNTITAKYRTNGSQIEISVENGSYTNSSDTTVATINSQYAPQIQLFASGTEANDYLKVGTDGTIALKAPTAYSREYITYSYK